MASKDAACYENSRFLYALQFRKRRESIGEVTVKRQSSHPIAPRLTRSSHAIVRRPKQTITSTFSMTRQRKEEVELDKSSYPSWDSPIDAFEVLRATITGITRNMQAFHVQEILNTELCETHHYDEEIAGSMRRLSSTSGRVTFTDDPVHYHQNHNQNHSHYRRRISHSSSSIDTKPSLPSVDTGESFLWTYPKEGNSPSLPTSPHLTSLFLTTNILIHSRLDELSETASIASSASHETTDLLTVEWRSGFLDLLSRFITQSEELETFSTEVLSSERRVRELMVVNTGLEEQFEQRFKSYSDRIIECEQVASQQLYMIESLGELITDLETHIIQQQEEAQAVEKEEEGERQEEGEERQEEEGESGPNSTRWDFSRAVVDLLSLEEKKDAIDKMRWDVGMCVGGGVGTGHVIHSFQGRLYGIEMMIGGSGITQHTESTAETVHTSTHLQHITLQHHQYLFHLSPKDRRDRFLMLPRHEWIPDAGAYQCQFIYVRSTQTLQCSAEFSFFQRRHHCRKCGKLVCQRHSGNQLPLFSSGSCHAQWSRVCDSCFHDIIARSSK
ncbi:hypothetical protein BDF14DRAFT_1966320 [Spinellus fusiger]|nr:hypothetical protein BDF14DRAFT_1966320 [Spinellus fusiger]